MKINEVVIDNQKGAGATPNNMEVDYKGFRVEMKPSTFLSLAAYVSRHTDKVEAMCDHLRKGGTIASPFLKILVPDEWKKADYSTPAQIFGHEGRHRMLGIWRTEDDIPVETHLFFASHNKSHVKPEWLEMVNKSLVSEDGDLIEGPFFKLLN